MRLNRVLALFALAILTGIGVIWVEGHNLRLAQKLAELDRQRELLAEEQARLRLEICRLAAPRQVMGNVPEGTGGLVPATVPPRDGTRASLRPYLQR